MKVEISPAKNNRRKTYPYLAYKNGQLVLVGRYSAIILQDRDGRLANGDGWRFWDDVRVQDRPALACELISFEESLLPCDHAVTLTND